MSENDLAKLAIDLGFKVHKKLGPGLLENVYEECLCYEIEKQGITVEKQKPLPLVYETVKLEVGYRVDLLVENKLIIEVKSIDGLNNIHLAQVMTYLRLSGLKLGLLLNFNTVLFKDGIQRVINGKL